jgi:CO/xanthine dehydrogenase FAD-binding subunit
VLLDHRYVAIPETLPEVLTAVDARPDARVIAGGTELMPDLLAGRKRPTGFVSLRRVGALRGVRRDGPTLVIGAATPIVDLLGLAQAPALAAAAANLGTPQVRNLATVGGNVMSALAYRNLLPALVALDAELELASSAGTRRVAYRDFTLAPGKTQRHDGEVLVAVRVPVLDGFQDAVKIGRRNAQFVAVSSAALVVDRGARVVRIGLGNAAPTPVRAPAAEAFAAEHVDWDGLTLGADAAAEAARLATAGADPPDDAIASSAYRRHATGVLVRRLLERAFGG